MEKYDSNKELIEALDILEKEKDISKEVLLETIENSLLAACKNQYGKADNIRVQINRETGEVAVYADKTVVEEVFDEALEITKDGAKALNARKKYEIGDVVAVEVTPKNFGRIAAGKAKQVVVQKIREEERKVIYNQYFTKERDIITGVVQRYQGNNLTINLGKADAILPESEMIYGETFRTNERIKVYVLKVEETTRGPRITVSRTHPELIIRLFENEVNEIRDGVVEIRSISREAGARTKIAVSSTDPNVDPIGACVGQNGIRVNAIVNELRGEKIDIVNWDDNPAELIKNALSPAKVVSVEVDEETHSAKVIVPNDQLSLAIGREGQNARLAARLTGHKIDIKSEAQAEEFYETWTEEESEQ